MIKRTEDRIVPKLLLLLSVIAIASFLVVEIYEYDIWWHLAIGRDILTSGQVPTTDAYTLAGYGRPYHDSHWFFQVVMAVADRWAGMVGVEVVMISIWSAALYACWRAIRNQALAAPVAALLLVLLAMACAERFMPRPDIVTLAMLALFYVRLQRAEYGPRALLGFGLLQLVWSNSHGLFVLGPFLVGCYWLSALLDGGPDRKHIPGLSRLLLVVSTATLLTPFGFSGWKYAWLLFTEVGSSASQTLKSVGELSPTFGAASVHGFSFWFYLTLLLLTIITTAVVIRQRRVAWPRLMLVGVMLLLSLTARRNMALFALVAAPLCAEQLPVSARDWLSRSLCRPLAGGIAAILLLILIWYPLSGNYYLTLQLPARSGWGSTPSYYPYALPEFLHHIGFKGQVFNSNGLGGFYLYTAPQGSLPFTDGRWEIYADKTFTEIMEAAQFPVAWRRFCQKYAIAGVLLQHSSPDKNALLPTLRKSGEWKLIYCDHAASFWVPTSRTDLPPLLDLNAGEWLSAPHRIDDTIMLDGFLQQMSADRARLRNLQNGLAFDAKNSYLLEQLGATQLQLGNLQEAEQAFSRLSQQDSKNTRALNELAFFAYQRGEKTKAVELLTRVLSLKPDDEDARANLNRILSAP